MQTVWKVARVIGFAVGVVVIYVVVPVLFGYLILVPLLMVARRIGLEPTIEWVLVAVMSTLAAQS